MLSFFGAKTNGLEFEMFKFIRKKIIVFPGAKNHPKQTLQNVMVNFMHQIENQICIYLVSVQIIFSYKPLELFFVEIKLRVLCFRTTNFCT